MKLNLKSQFIVVLTIQVICLVFLVFDVSADLSGIDNQNSIAENHVFELIVVLALIMSIAIITREFLRVTQRNKKVEGQLHAARGAFQALLDQNFAEWDLTESERDVSLLAIKGLDIQEISHIRDTKQGTIKAQLNAIYRKAGVNGRPQLISLFIEELMDNNLSETK